jgi:hypothetical protein
MSFTQVEEMQGSVEAPPKRLRQEMGRDERAKRNRKWLAASVDLDEDDKPLLDVPSAHLR